MYYKNVDMRSRKAMTEFLSKHFRYSTLNSWNQLTSYANNIKLTNLNLPDEVEDKAWDVICGNVETDFFDITMSDLIQQFQYETGYTVGMNGRSNGYLVLYSGKIKQDPHRSYCACCGQKSYAIATKTDKKCGRCGADARENFRVPLEYFETSAKSIDSNDPGYFLDWTLSELKDRVKLVQKFDILCDNIRTEFINELKTKNIVEKEITITKKIKVLT